MGSGVDGAGSSSAAANTAGAAAAQLPVSSGQPAPPPAAQPMYAAPPGYPGAQQQYAPPPAGYGAPQGYGAPHPGYGAPPGSMPVYNAAAQPQGHHSRPPLVSIISPDDAKKIRKMQWINFAATMLQLTCSLAIIIIVRNSLISVTFGGGPIPSVNCLAATPAYPGTCEYAYSLASVSIFFGFILSLMQCLTMDCCGAGRAVEAGFDAAAAMWWVAGGITLGLRASEANREGVPQFAARNAVVAMCWLSAGLFLVLLVTNFILIKRLGKAYKAAAQQMQQHMTAQPAMGVPGYGPGAYPGGVQMVPMGGAPHGHPQQGYGAPAGYPPQGAAPGGAYPQPQQPPAGYPTQQFPAPAGTAAAPQNTGV